MFLANQQARPVAYAQKKCRRAAEPQEPRLVDDDRLGALAAASSSSSTSRRSSSAAITETAGGVRDLYRLEMENFSNPLMVGLLRAQHGGRRLAPVARRRRAPSSRSAPTIRAGRRGVLAAGKVLAVVIAGGFIVIALWAHLAGGGRV